MKLLIVRHGETYDNIHNLITGQKDVDLTEEGKKQARELVEKISKEQIDIIYCSTLTRAKDTINPYLAARDVPIVYTDKMREFDLGKFNGFKPENLTEERNKGLEHKVGDGESLRDLYNRANSFLEELTASHPNETVLLVGHNAINRNIIGIIKGYSIEEINEKKERYPNTSIQFFDNI